MKIFTFFLLLTFTLVNSETRAEKEVSLMKFGMQAILEASPGKGDELAEIMLQASKIVSTLQGCELYIVQQSLTDSSKILITEVWENKEFHQASLSNSSVRELIGKAKPILVGMEHNPAVYIGGHGL